MATIEEMKLAVQVGDTRVLTLERAIGLAGKKIATIQFDFQRLQQPTVDEFTVGEIKREFDLHPNQQSVLMEFKDRDHVIKKMKSTLEIITKEGRRTFIQTTAANYGIFTGPDLDYEVWFKELGT
jgi:hypothetical protein